MLGIRRIGNNYYVVFQPNFTSFQDLTIVLSTLLPVISMNSENKRHSGSSVGRKVSHWSLPFYVVNATYNVSGLFHFCSLYFGIVVYKSFACHLSVLQAYNEVQRCFLTVGLVYPEDLFTFLLNVRTHFVWWIWL